MKYLAAYCLSVLSGKNQPTADDIKKILSSVGIEAQNDSVNRVINEMKGKSIQEVIKAGSGKMVSISVGPSTGSGPVQSQQQASSGAPKKEQQKEEPKEEEEEDMDMGDLFG